MPVADGLYYETHGPVDAPPLILSSGLGGSASYWAPNLPALAERHRVILYDHRGTGRSDRTLSAPHLPDAGMTHDLKTLMDRLGIASAHVVGHAAGAMIGMRLAGEWPERVRSLVLVNGWAALDPHFARCFDVRLAILRDSGVRAYVHAQPLFLYPANWIALRAAQIDEEEDAHVAQFPDPAVVERRIAALRHFDYRAELSRLRVATLVVTAEDDMLVPSDCGRRLAAMIPGARLATMAWGGHACNVTDPASFDALVLDFLGS
jgi:aminoacrylate hydrolase